MMLGFFPNPINWGWDKATGWAGGALAATGDAIFNGLAAWFVSGAVWAAGTVYETAVTTTTLNLKEPWFTAGIHAPAVTAGLILLTVAMMWTTARSALTGRIDEMVGRVVVQAPKAIVLMVLLVEFVSIGTKVSAEIAGMFIFSATGSETEDVFGAFEGLDDIAASSGALASIIVVVVAALLMIGSLGVILVLMASSAGVVFLTGLMPIFVAALATKHNQLATKAMMTLAVLVITPALVSITLVMAGATLTNAGPTAAFLDANPAEVLALAPVDPGEGAPELSEAQIEAEGQATSQVIGQMMVGVIMVVLALFSPIAVMSMLPSVEAATTTLGAGANAGGSIANAPGVAPARRTLAARRAKRARPTLK